MALRTLKLALCLVPQIAAQATLQSNVAQLPGAAAAVPAATVPGATVPTVNTGVAAPAPAVGAVPSPLAPGNDVGSQFANQLLGQPGERHGGMVGSVLKTLESSMGGGGGIAGDYDDEAQLIAEGMISAFFAGAAINPTEKACIQNNMGESAKELVGAGESLVGLIKGLMAGTETGPDGDQHHSMVRNTLITNGIAGAADTTGLVTSVRALVQGCFRADGIAMMKLAGERLGNFTYMKGRFVAEGVDVAQNLAKSIVDWDEKKYRYFGEDFGNILRKILLSQNMGQYGLPEGGASPQMIERVTEGVMNGFFATGSVLGITDTQDPQVDFEIDLNRCIVGNRRVWEDAFEGICLSLPGWL